MLIGALVMVLFLLRKLLRVSLLKRERVLGNRTCHLIDH